MSDLAAVSGVDLGSRISVAVARKALDAAREEGAQVVSLLQSARDVQDTSRGAVSGPDRPAGVDVYG